MGALDGILVVAIEQAVAAPLCTVRLADAGARVIKVERSGGETARNYDAAVKGTSAYFAWLNRGKESVVLDLKAKDDLDVLRRMLTRADVLVQNLAPGAMDRMGLSDRDLARDFPQLIAVSIVGYGQDTDCADMKAYDLLVQAETGLCAITGSPDVPAKIGVSAADIATGSNAHAAILEALLERGQTGLGQAIEISMFDGIADWMAVPLLHYEHGGTVTGRHGMSHASIYPYGPFNCRDGVIVIAVQTNDEWIRFCRDVLDRADLLDRPDFATNPLRVENRKTLDTEIDPHFARASVADAQMQCERAGIAWARFTEVQDLGKHPALRRCDITLSDGTVVTVPRPAGRTDQFKAGKLPGLGEHTYAVRQEFGKP